MKILFFSDSHEVASTDFRTIRNLDHNSFDVIVYLGDIQEDLMNMINQWFPHKPKIGVRGNHDPYKLDGLGTFDLHRKNYLLNDISFEGFEGSLRYKDSFSPAFPLYSQTEVHFYMKDLSGCDIFISHTSPYGVNEKDFHSMEGFKEFNKYIEEFKPAYVFHGHQHLNKETILENETRVISIYGFGIYDIFERKFKKKYRWGE